jgi:hypothetical protein
VPTILSAGHKANMPVTPGNPAGGPQRQYANENFTDVLAYGFPAGLPELRKSGRIARTT